MYSPKIREEYIPYLYKLAKHLDMPMTTLVNQILAPVIERFKASGIFEDIEEEERLVSELSAHFRRLARQRKMDTAKIIELLRDVA
jgi:hypothetical protein